MKKIKKSYGEGLDPVILYYDDLERIIEIFKEGSKEINISTDEYEFEDITEIQKIDKEKLDSLTIDIQNPYVSLNFKPDSIWLYISEDTSASRGIFEKLKYLLTKRRRILCFPAKSYFFSGVLSGGIIGWSFWFLLNAIVFEENIVRNVQLGGIILILGIILSYWILYFIPRNYSTIYTKKRNELPSFWARKKDDIFLVILGSILGIVGTLLITILF